MRPWAPAVVVGVAALVAAGWWFARGTGSAEVGSSSAPGVDPTPLVSAATPEVPAPATDLAEVAWVSAVDQVAARCDLGLVRACEGGRCVAVVEVPVLTGPVGWARMAWRSPRLVAAVVAGDLGLPDRVSACRDAIRELPHGTTRARSAGEGEVWCLAGSTGAEVDRLCDALSHEAFGLSPSFSTGADRIVELRPPGV